MMRRLPPFLRFTEQYIIIMSHHFQKARKNSQKKPSPQPLPDAKILAGLLLTGPWKKQLHDGQKPSSPAGLAPIL
jgi:hypothetical protein